MFGAELLSKEVEGRFKKKLTVKFKEDTINQARHSFNLKTEDLSSDIMLALPGSSKADGIDKRTLEPDAAMRSKIHIAEEDKETMTDPNSSNSTLEKDSGLSRMTDSDNDALPPPLQDMCALHASSSNSIDRKLKRCENEISLEKELAMLHKEMETIRLECDRLISKHENAEKRVMKQVAQADSLINTMTSLGGKCVLGRIEETSSAYNTGGESCRSTPLKCDFPNASTMSKSSCTHQLRSDVSVLPPHASDSAKVSASEAENQCTSITHKKFRLPQFSVVLRECDLRKKKPAHVSASRKPLQKSSYKAGETMYTSPENLAETIALQQRLLRQSLVKATSKPKPQTPSVSNNEEQQYEWKLKRRSDGTKYITKKPIRSRLLKEREEQLNKERCGITTDDDAMSELKTGRFWSREERKKHLERAKERKLRQHQIIAEKQQMPSDQIIVQLSHKKMMRKEGRHVFDKYTTLQEFLAHGIRGPTNRLIEGVLSVTTV